jgi:hypothetical protein
MIASYSSVTAHMVIAGCSCAVLIQLYFALHISRALAAALCRYSSVELYMLSVGEGFLGCCSLQQHLCTDG